jgi:hypothetical protein
VNAKPTANPMAKKSNVKPDEVTTLFLGSVDPSDKETYLVSDLQKRCAEKNATHIGYNRDDTTFYSIAIKDLIDLEKNYDSLHRHLNLPHETRMEVQTHGAFVFENNSVDTTESVFTTSFHTLQNISKKAYEGIQTHEVGHSLFWHHHYSKQNGEQSTGSYYMPIAGLDMPAGRALENYSDSVAVTLSGRAHMDAQMEVAGYINKLWDYLDNPNTVLKYTYGFNRDIDDDHPSLGQRFQYQEALVLYFANKDTMETPMPPPRLKKWKPQPAAN